MDLNKIDNDLDIINLSLYFEAKTFLKGLLLLDDKLGMCHSLENRVPFLDNNLVEFAKTCPADLKIKNFYNNKGKYILRKMLKRIFIFFIPIKNKVLVAQIVVGLKIKIFLLKKTLNEKNINFNIIDRNEVKKILE